MQKIIFVLLIFCCSFARADCDRVVVPAPEFLKSLKLAQNGNVIEQRNVAVSYEVGYLVSRCFADAYFWYSKAAEAEDSISVDWIARQNVLIGLHDGREFMTVHRVEKHTAVETPLPPPIVPVQVPVNRPEKIREDVRLYWMGITGG